NWVNEFENGTATVNGQSVTLNFMLKGGSTTSSTLLFTLPASMRPNKNMFIIATSGYTLTNTLVNVFLDGRVVLNSTLSDNNRLTISTSFNI
ncbi:MAG: hypothetical protein ACRDD8_10165, partial [Bacteroidales bacterium]